MIDPEGSTVNFVQDTPDPAFDPTDETLSSGRICSAALAWAMANCLCRAAGGAFLGKGGGAFLGAPSVPPEPGVAGGAFRGAPSEPTPDMAQRSQALTEQLNPTLKKRMDLWAFEAKMAKEMNHRSNQDQHLTKLHSCTKPTLPQTTAQLLRHLCCCSEKLHSIVGEQRVLYIMQKNDTQQNLPFMVDGHAQKAFRRTSELSNCTPLAVPCCAMSTAMTQKMHPPFLQEDEASFGTSLRITTVEVAILAATSSGGPKLHRTSGRGSFYGYQVHSNHDSQLEQVCFLWFMCYEQTLFAMPLCFSSVSSLLTQMHKQKPISIPA